MRRIAIVGMILVSLVAVPLVAAAAPSPKSEVCHVQDDGEMKTLTVGGKALQAHLNHGDTEGPCEEAPPADDTPPADEPLAVSFSATVDHDSCFWGLCTVTLESSVNTGAPLTYDWFLNGSLLPVHDPIIQVSMASGTSMVVLAVDDGTNTATHELQVTVP